MVSIDDFKRVLTLLYNYEVPHLIERDIKIDLYTNKIITIAGARRSGKTYVMFQCMLVLQRTGV